MRSAIYEKDKCTVSMMQNVDLAILGAVAFEVEPLSSIMERAWIMPFLGETLRLGAYNGRSILIGTTGLGKVNAAIVTAAILERFRVGQVWSVGCAGAYRGSPLQVGDVLVTDRSLCGDEGILTQAGVLSGRGIRIPILSRDGHPYYDYIPTCHDRLLAKLCEATPAGPYRLERDVVPIPAIPCGAKDRQEGDLSGHSQDEAEPGGSCPSPTWPSGVLEVECTTLDVEAPYAEPTARNTSERFHLFYGPGLTVGMVSGEPEIASDRFQRYDAFAENMEGSAVAQACFRFDVPMVECRGISNWAGDRRKEYWRLDLALAHCHGIVLHWLNHLSEFSTEKNR